MVNGLVASVTHLAVSVGHSERHVGGHEQQQRLLLRQLLLQPLYDFSSFRRPLQIKKKKEESYHAAGSQT